MTAGTFPTEPVAAGRPPMVCGFRVDWARSEDGFAICRPSGELDAYTIPAFRQAIADAASEPGLIIDLSGVPFVDSAGLGALIGGIRRIRDLGGDAVLVSGRPVLGRLLHQTGFDSITAVTDDLDQAAAALRRTLHLEGAVPAGGRL